MKMLTGTFVVAACFLLLAVGESWTSRAAESQGQRCSTNSATNSATEAPQVDLLAAKAERLRQKEGPAALVRLLEQYDRFQEKLSEGPADPELLETSERLTRLVDLVAGQRYGTKSRLYWYTDLDEARAVADENGKPLLCLRMLGRLTDELSCANSRFFRTTLYADPVVSDFLSRHFVLHWQSVRPVPVITIDFGEGRTLRRTITGNGAHYVVSSDGQPIDVLPGLYGPSAFIHALQSVLEVERSYRQTPSSRERIELLHRHHAARLEESNRAWAKDLRQLGIEPTANQLTVNSARPARVTAAEAANRFAIPKSFVELPMLRAVGLARANEAPAISSGELRAATTDGTWERIGALHQDSARISEASRELIRSENPTAATAMQLAVTKARVEDPIVKLIRNFESSIAVDTVRNEYLLRAEVHRWFNAEAEENFPRDLDTLNRRVYAELFLTPDSDPWLGLAPADAYTGLQEGGLE